MMKPAFPPISETYPLILASASPRRKQLLNQVMLPFRAVPSDIDEKVEGLAGSPRSAVFLAKKKAKDVYTKVGEHWVLGADTVVVLGERLLGKPADAEEVQAMLSLLSGQEHRVVTGFALLDPSGNEAYTETTTTYVKMKELSNEDISNYLTTDEPYGKAGSYAIQGIGVFMVEEINGSYSNVVGLPLCAFIKALLQIGALRSFPLS
jgi:septum formation protein